MRFFIFPDGICGAAAAVLHARPLMLLLYLCWRAAAVGTTVLLPLLLLYYCTRDAVFVVPI